MADLGYYSEAVFIVKLILKRLFLRLLNESAGTVVHFCIITNDGTTADFPNFFYTFVGYSLLSVYVPWG